MSELKKRKKWMIILDRFLIILFPMVIYLHYLENGLETSTYIVGFGFSLAWFNQIRRLYKDKQFADSNNESDERN